MWRTYIQGMLDFGSQVWTPVKSSLLLHLESTQKSFTKYTEGLDGMNYWERLEIMRLTSIQRRHERYRLVYLWKIMMGMVPNYGISWNWTDKGGRKVDIPRSTYIHSAIARNMRDQSLVVHGGRIYNLLPRKIRDFSGPKEGFKVLLDTYLKEIPDQPVSEGLMPEPLNNVTCKNSNSLYEWISFLKLNNRKFSDLYLSV